MINKIQVKLYCFSSGRNNTNSIRLKYRMIKRVLVFSINLEKIGAKKRYCLDFNCDIYDNNIIKNQIFYKISK